MFLFPLCGLKLECEKLVGEKTEIQKYYGMVSREVERMVENEKWEERSVYTPVYYPPTLFQDYRRRVPSFFCPF